MNSQAGASRPLSRAAASAALTGLGWRHVLGAARTTVQAASPLAAAAAAAGIVARCGQDAGDRLLIDLRGDRLILTVQNLAAGLMDEADVALAGQVTEVLTGLGIMADPGIGAAAHRSVQMIEIAIDALDIGAIRPFWRAVLGYGDEAGRSGPRDPIVDPQWQGPAIWFQQMTRARPQRNRIHLDISVPHDEAPGRIKAALTAGGVLVSDAHAPAFWVLADPERNEACITTWQGRDA